MGLDIETHPGFYVNTNYQFNDKYALNDANTDYNPSYDLLNGKIGYKTNFGRHFKLDIYAGLNNITNEKYTSVTALNAPDYGNGRAYFDPSPENKRVWGVNLSYQF